MPDTPIEVVRTVDFTSEDIRKKPHYVNVFYPPTKTFRLEEEREKKRGQIAVLLVRLLVGIVVASFVFTYLRSVTSMEIGGIAVKDVKEILTMIFSPIVALVGAVTGFYFGGKSEGEARDTNGKPNGGSGGEKTTTPSREDGEPT